jgi:glutathione synthase/RimK-type ligase-like ATP-grasp enzyme
VRDESVLVVGAADDIHVTTVADALRARDAHVTVLDANALDTRLSYCPNEEPAILQIAGSHHAFTAVWWRRKPTKRQLDDPAFADREWVHALEPLTELLAGARWVNPRRAELTFRYKPTQLQLAHRCGFRVPRTLVTNDPHEVRAFVASCGGTAIYKCLSWYIVGDRFLFTNVIHQNDLDAYEESIALAPGIYQPLIKKSYELRVTIVGDAVFAARIDSQDGDDTRIDWRRNIPSLSHSAVRLPADVHEMLLRFHAESGLVAGAYDLIVTPEGEHVFLEVNPAGQWLWIEHETGLPISESMASALLGDPISLSPASRAMM